MLTVVKMAELEMSNEQLSTSEVAKGLGVSPSLVRTWVSYLNLEVRRNAEGHRIFGGDEVEELRKLKAWLDDGHSLKEFRREMLGEGEYDPRLELRGAFRRLRELQYQDEALMAKQHEILEATRTQREALKTQLEAIRASIGPVEGEEAPAAPASGPDRSQIVQGVLKQLLSSLLEKQGKLQLVRRYEEDGRTMVEYAGPTGKKQVVEDMTGTDEDRRLMETVLAIILKG